jgi:hypothetical protein
MKKDAELANKRDWLKHEITIGMDSLLAGLIFDRVSRTVQKISGTSQPPPLYYTTTILAILIVLPGLTAIIVFGELDQFQKTGLTNFIYLGFSLVALIVARVNIRHFLGNVRDHIVDLMNDIRDLSSLHRVLSKLWSARRSWLFGLAFGLIVTIVVVKFTSDSIGGFIGVGATISLLIASVLNGIVVYYIFQMLLLPWTLGQYHYELHEPNPSHSITIRHLSYSLNTYVYIVAAFSAALTLWVGSNPITASSNVIVLFTNWLPLVAQFISNHVAMGRIISTAKWEILGKIEHQIRALHNETKAIDKKTAELTSQLSNYHERISKTRNSALDVGAGLSLLNQLLLPLLAIAITNWDEILAFFY